MPFKIVRDDLTRMQVDVIVNTANPRPLIGSGTDYAVYMAAGPEKLQKERAKIGDIARGDAAVTKAYALPAKYIIHTVGPIWRGGHEREEEILRSCYEKSLNLAAAKKCKSIAFPLISTGNYGFPKDLALKIVVDTVWKFLEQHDMMIYLVVFGSGAARISEKMFASIESRIDDKYVEEKENLEYMIDYMNAPMLDMENVQFYDYRGEPGNLENTEILRPGSKPLREADYSAHADYSMPVEPSVHQDYSMPMESSEDADYFMPTASPPLPSASTGEAGKSAAKSRQLKPEKKSPKKSSVRDLSKLLEQQEETFRDMLLRLIRERGLTNAQAYVRANQDKKLFSKIKTKEDYQPGKKVVLAFAIALELNLDETKDLLARAGYAFSPSSNFDKVIQYCIEEKEYDIFNIEIILYDLGLECLCNY